MDIPDWWAPNGHVQFVNVKIRSAFDGPRFRFKIGKADIHRKAGWPDGNTLRFSCFMDPDFLSTLLNVDDRMERRKWREWRRQGKGLADVSSSIHGISPAFWTHSPYMLDFFTNWDATIC